MIYLLYQYSTYRINVIRNYKLEISTIQAFMLLWLPVSMSLWPPAPLQWRHNEHDGVSNHQPHDCLLNRLSRRRSKKTSKVRVTGLCAGNSPVTGEFPAERASNAENVSIWWRHHSASPCRDSDAALHRADSHDAFRTSSNNWNPRSANIYTTQGVPAELGWRSLALATPPTQPRTQASERTIIVTSSDLQIRLRTMRIWISTNGDIYRPAHLAHLTEST